MRQLNVFLSTAYKGKYDNFQQPSLGAEIVNNYSDSASFWSPQNLIFFNVVSFQRLRRNRQKIPVTTFVTKYMRNYIIITITYILSYKVTGVTGFLISPAFAFP
jgi:hypothetical protein